MRGKARWGCLATFVLVATLAGCGDDDHAFKDGGADSGDASGRGGAAGGDSGRTDTNMGRGGSGGTGDAGPDRSSDGQGGDVGPDAAPDRGPSVDVSADAGETSIADSSLDLMDEDGNAVIDARIDGDDATPNDASDATVDALDAGDATTSDGGDVSSGDASDATDATFLDTRDAPSCSDSNVATIDFYNPNYGCGHKYDANPSDNDAWITYDAGFHVDVATGLGWAFPPGSRSASAAAIACDAFTVVGLVNWRMATIDEARSLAGGCAPTASGGSCPLDDPSCLAMACGQGSPACDSCTGGAGPNSGAYCKVDVAICSHFHTSSLCTDCGDAGAKDWIYATSNGNFLPFDSPAGIPTACVSVVPNGVPDGGR